LFLVDHFINPNTSIARWPSPKLISDPVMIPPIFPLSEIDNIAQMFYDSLMVIATTSSPNPNRFVSFFPKMNSLLFS
jgi:hypothetical protein